MHNILPTCSEALTIATLKKVCVCVCVCVCGLSQWINDGAIWSSGSAMVFLVGATMD